MKTKFKEMSGCNCNVNKNYSMNQSCMGAVYGLGFVGAAIYYISNATGFWMGALGVLKALVWPAFLVYEMLKLVGA
jgi:hypothetical protein